MPTAHFLRVRELAELLRYPAHQFDVVEKTSGVFLRVSAVAADSDTNMISVKRGRKWYVSPQATDSEIVRTAFKALLTFIEHEAREFFTYKGVSVFGPHIDVEALRLLGRHRLDKR